MKKVVSQKKSFLVIGIHFLAVMSLVLIVNCSPKDEKADAISYSPLTSGPENTRQNFHRLTPEECGIEFTNQLDPQNSKDFLQNGAGLCIGDINNDGMPDIYLVSEDSPNKLYTQVEPMKFVDVTEQAGVQGNVDWGSGATFADIDNDGDLDLYLCTYQARNQLFINNGEGIFTESAAEAGLDFEGPSTMAAFADFDKDGDLDCYLLNSRRFHVSEEVNTKAKVRMVDGKLTAHPDFLDQYQILEGRFIMAGQSDRYYINNGDGTFTDQTIKAGIAGYDMGLSVTCWDFNNDGWLDIYVGDDLKTPDHLYRNNKDGTFTDIIKSTLSHTTWNSMGADTGDLNNDGLIDFIIADMANTTHFKSKTSMGAMSKSAWFLDSAVPRQYMRNSVFLNTNTEHFLEIAFLGHMSSSDWTWCVRINDLDNDGWNDVLFTNGMERNTSDSDLEIEFNKLMQSGKKDEATQAYLKWPRMPEKNLVFKNLGGLHFKQIQEDWNLDLVGVSQATAMADLDRDGDLDLIMNNMNEPIAVYRNDSTNHHSAIIKLNGTESNRFGIGTKVSIVTDSGAQVRQLILARGYMSADEPLIHFGLGGDSMILEMRVEWPSGILQVFHNIPANQFVTITEMGEKSRTPISQPTRMFSEIDQSCGIDFVHAEMIYDDFEREPLLPFKLSQLGPGMATGDVNGNGHDDLYIGGAAGQAGSLYYNLGDGNFQPNNQVIWESDKLHEDMEALFFDVDGDGDQDLYVVSGSNEYPLDDPLLQDRLYINQGDGTFKKSSMASLQFTRNSGSVVVGSDFDKDGDIDLFIGSRMIPGRYPLVPKSVLLMNQGGQLKEAKQRTAPSLSEIGLVTDAIWSDYDMDGWDDLLVTIEWGTIHVFHNEKGILVDKTEACELNAFSGWWNGIAQGDIDGDGDLDYVVTNLGHNTKYHATDDKPASLYCSDFDDNGGLDIIETKFEGQTHYPVRGRSCSSTAMPFIADKFKTYKEFALASLDDIYTKPKLNAAFQVNANYFSSAVLINNGAGQFDVHELPVLAQVAPGFSPVLTDFNKDGHLDLFIAQNFYHPQRETGRWDGGLSIFLLGNGDGSFQPVWPDKSGIIIPGDAVDVSVIDINADSKPDLIVSQNNQPPKIYINQM